MFLNADEKVRNVNGISEEQKRKIMDFLQGAVYCWCNSCPGKWFSLQSLMGGKNSYWQGTPLYILYEIAAGEGDGESAENMAARKAGWLLKSVLKSDKRTFETKEGFRKKYFRWDGKP
ncbi:hypothetical protein [uncultured Fibrobacter sp.]|uniref:hypothetical protein n=1 Tax=uncultured Fibrobacter sp. TaxID=261512 RepID=UPI0028057D9F|nr:hypothetical protein [uncultured Fibrobacter sp.]